MNKRVRGCKSQVTVKQFTIQLTQAMLRLGFYIWKPKSLNWERIFMKTSRVTEICLKVIN